jgi:drug/metabolite transporter, DME family
MANQTGHMRLGVLAVAGAAATWSMGAIAAGALLADGMDPLQLATARVVLTAGGFAIAALLVPRKPGGGSVPLPYVVAFATAIGGASVAIFLAIARLGVAVGTVLHYLAPLMVVAYGAISTRRRPSGLLLGTAALSLLGVVLASGAASGGVRSLGFGGVAIGLSSAAFFAAYTVMADRVIVAYGPLHALLRGFSLAAIGWVAVQVVRGWPAMLFAPDAVGWVVFVGLIGTCLPFLLYIWGVQRVQAERAAIAATLEPVMSGVVAWVLLGQSLEPLQVVGCGLILAAVVALQVRNAQADRMATVDQRIASRYQSP